MLLENSELNSKVTRASLNIVELWIYDLCISHTFSLSILLMKLKLRGSSEVLVRFRLGFKKLINMGICSYIGSSET